MERFFERFLWNSRFIVLVAVIASLVVGLAMFFVSTIDVAHLIENIIKYTVDDTGEEKVRGKIVAGIVEIIDGYLLATMMLVFSFGLYELFISRIDAAEGNELASRVLLIQNMDDLKDRLSKLVLLILIVKFFQHAVDQTSDKTPMKPLDLLYFSIGIFLIGAALYVSHKKSPAHDKEVKNGGSVGKDPS